jgi:nicotinamide mononucleotide transporter
MSLLSIIALIFGTLGVILTIKQSIYCWPAALIAVVASVAEFYQEKLYGDMALQVFYFFAGIYGWVYWNKKKNTAFIITPIDRKAVPALLGMTLAQFVLYYYLLNYFKGDKVMFDAILTACSLTVTYMMTKKWLENWILWVLIDGAYVILYGVKEMWLFAVLYLFMAIIAFYGWIKWRKVVSSK